MTRTLRRTLLRNWNRLLGSLFRRNADGDLADELDSHIRLLAEEEIRRGVPPEEAHRRARLQFGSVESTKESYRDQRGLPALDTLVQDLRYAFRGIRKNPGFASVAILSLAIGIGANTAIFSLVNSVLLQPLAYKDPQRLFAVREIAAPNWTRMPVNPVHAREWAKQCPSLEDVALMRSNRAQVSAGGEPASIPGADVPHNLFTLFGVEPILGRAFLAEEEREGNDRVVILSESLWRSRFNADVSLLGKTILIDGQNRQVVGIAPASVRLPYHGATNVHFEIFRPLVINQEELSRLMGNFNYAAVIRLKPGVAAEQALAEINVIEARFPRLTDSGIKDLKATLTPVHELFTGRARLGLWILAAAVGAVLLIVCVNLANLLLSRIASRHREAAIRTALGASRARQFRMVLTESLLLAVSGGALGIVFANWSVQLLVATTTLDIPRLDEARLNSSVLVFSFCLTLLTALVFGALPAWRFSRNDPQEALRAGSHTVTEGRRSLRLREGLISLEVGLSAALLIVAGLLATSLSRLLEVDKGFDAGHVLTVDIGLAGPRYAEPVNRERFFDRLLANVSAMPGVQAAGVVTALPTLGDEIWTDPIYLEGDGRRRSERHSVNNRFSSPGYFRTMNIAVRQGREFQESDREQSVAVLSEKAAKLLWPGEVNPVGRRFMGEDNKPKTLVGVVADVRGVLHNDSTPMAYYPYWQVVPERVALVVRTTGGPRTAAGGLRTALRHDDAQLPIQAIRTMDEVVDRSVAQRRFQLTLMGAFAASALLVASLGIYGVVSYSVARRRNEIGIRMALGAQRSQLLGLVIRQGMAPVVVGLATGVAFALFLSGAIRGLLFGVLPSDTLTIAGVTVALLAVGALACLIPALRAVGTDAVAALRFE